MKVILVNGPPSAGKDTICKHLFHHYKDHYNVSDVLFDRFSRPNKTAFAAVTNTEYNHFLENDEYENKKDEIIPWLGVSYRQWQIDFAEFFMKPKYGKNIFSKLLLDRIHTYNQLDPDSVLVVPDLGFDIEPETIEKCSPIHCSNYLVIRTHRKGFDFSKDSRNYVYPNQLTSIDVQNNGVKDLQKKAEVIFEAFVGGRDVNQYNEVVTA